MSILITIITVFLQLLAGQVLGLNLPWILRAGDGWQLLVVIPLGNTLGVFGVGAVAMWLQGKRWLRLYKIRLVGTAVGSAFGSILIRITPGTGINQVLYPLFGGVLGFYLLLWLLNYYFERK